MMTHKFHSFRAAFVLSAIILMTGCTTYQRVTDLRTGQIWYRKGENLNTIFRDMSTGEILSLGDSNYSAKEITKSEAEAGVAAIKRDAKPKK